MMDTSKLKDHLVKSGRLTTEQVLQAEDYALTMKIPIEEAIIFLKQLNYHALGQSLSEIYEKPYQSLLDEPPPDQAKLKVPLKAAERLQVFPVSFDTKQNILTLAIGDPEDELLAEKLKNSFPAPIKVVCNVASNPEIMMAINVYYKGKDYTPEIELELPEGFTIVTSDQEEKKELDLENDAQSKKKILLLEPDLDRARALATILRKEGFPNVKWVASPGEILDACKTDPSNLLLANGRIFKTQGTWLKEIPQEVELPPVSYYNLKPMLLGQEYPYEQMSEALISLVAFIVRNSLKDKDDQLQEIVTRVRYCKLLALRLGLAPVQVDSVVIAAWLSSPGLGDLLLSHIETPYGLDEIVNSEQSNSNGKRMEATVLDLVQKYQLLKKKSPESTSNLEMIRKELYLKFPSSDDKTLLEAFLNVIRDEEFLQGVDQTKNRILLVDPDFSQDSSIVLRLLNDGYEVTGVTEASKAAKKIMSSGTDFIISEVNLPGSDGIRLCRAVRGIAKTAHIPFFFLTAEEEEKLATECLEAGADDFLKKPGDPDLLALKIKHILSIKAPKEAKRGVSGTLADMSVADIIQSITAGDKDVEIILENMGQKGCIYIQQGEIVHARSGGFEGEEAFYALMAWQEGNFEIVSCSNFPSHSIHNSAMSLLMEGARLADEINDDEEA